MLVGHEKQWKFLTRKFESGQLSHAYLFAGPREIGKKTFALEFAEFIGCKSPDLVLVNEANKKDLKFGDGGEIKISQIREVQNFLSYKSYYGGYKVVIVDEAEKMNQEAQSCFLKTLEEPKGQTLMILVTSKPDMLLETISSRCQTLNFYPQKGFVKDAEKLAEEERLLKELIAAANSDLAAKFKYSKAFDFDKNDFSRVLETMQRYMRHYLLKEAGVAQEDGFQGLPAIRSLSLEKIKKIIDLIEDLNKKLIFTNASPKLALEILLMEF